MMNRRDLLTLGILCCGLCFSDLATAAPHGSSSEPAAEVSAARRLLGDDFRSDLRSEASYRGRGSVYLRGPTSSVLLDRQTGLAVEVYNDTKTFGVNGPPQITSDQALARAIEFLDTTGVVLAGAWTLTQNKYLEGSRQYDFIWRRIFYGIELPSFIDVTIDADDSRVLHYILVDDPVVIPLQVNLTGEQALAIVTEKKRWVYPIVKAADLQVWYPSGYPGPQALIWRFEIMNPGATTGSNSYVWAEVNATTGEITRLDGPAGFFGLIPKGEKLVSVALPKPNVKALRKAKAPPTVFQLAKMKKLKKSKLSAVPLASRSAPLVKQADQ